MSTKNQLSRRQIRIKIFELIYSKEVSAKEDKNLSVQEFTSVVKQSEMALTALALFISKVFDYTLVYANQQASKLVQTSTESVDTSLARVAFVTQLQENESFINSIKEHQFANVFPQDLVRKFYLKLRETDAFKAYEQDKENKKNIEQLILEVAENALIEETALYQFFTERFIHWEDDLEWITKWIPVLAQSPKQIGFEKTLDEDRITFADELINSYFQKEDYLFELIKPKLKNWEADRIALIDQILLKMGLAELVFFPSIPVKVSINEYIDIAKLYSTKQSGQFVNGVLDNLRKELEGSGEIRKFDKIKK